ncbi:MAG: DUF2029 domain-containing protein [Clostridia bacterium]|nr:DUF2029 domain-containing protein [Clostridia bacterium]
MTLDVNGKPKKKNFLFASAMPLSSKQNKLLNLLCYTVAAITVASMLGIILYYIYAFAALSMGSDRFDWLLSIFSDFVEIMNASLKQSPYLTNGTSYPPIAVVVLYPFAWICRGVFSAYSGMQLTLDELTARVILHPEFWIAIVLFFVLSIAALWLIITKKYHLDAISSLKAGALLMFSAPCVYAIMRGNTIYFALIFSLLFLLLYDHPKAWVREIGYLCLVLAGCIKLYPLFLGVFLLKQKKFFAATRVAVYFFVLFFLSFQLFRTGIDGMNPFLDNLGGFMFNGERLLSLRNLSLSSLIYKTFYLISPTLANSTFFAVFSLCLLLFTFAMAVVTAIFTKSTLSRSMIAAGIIILIPTVSYFYVLVFTFLPLMEFIKSVDEISERRKTLYTVLFLFLYSCCFLLTQCFVPHAIIVIAMLVIEEASVIRKELLPRLKNRKERHV